MFGRRAQKGASHEVHLLLQDGRSRHGPADLPGGHHWRGHCRCGGRGGPGHAHSAGGRQAACQPAEARAGHLAGRRRQPARNVGPQARHRHRRPVPGHPDLRARHAHLRAAAAHRQADAPPGPRPRHQHQGERPRQGRTTSCTPAASRSPACEYPHLGAVAAKLLDARPTTRCPATSTSRARRRRRQQRRRGLPRPALRLRRARRRQAAAEHAAARRR